MTIPVFDNIRMVDKEGMLTPEWKSILTDLFATLQDRMSDEGLVMPSQPASNIALLTSSDNGAMVYDSDNNVAKININGTFKTIQTV